MIISRVWKVTLCLGAVDLKSSASSYLLAQVKVRCVWKKLDTLTITRYLENNGTTLAEPPPNVQRIFLFCKNRFQDKLADSSSCDNAKRRSALGGFAPDPLTRGSALAPRWRLNSQTPIIGSPCAPPQKNSGPGSASVMAQWHSVWAHENVVFSYE